MDYFHRQKWFFLTRNNLFLALLCSKYMLQKLALFKCAYIGEAIWKLMVIKLEIYQNLIDICLQNIYRRNEDWVVFDLW